MNGALGNSSDSAISALTVSADHPIVIEINAQPVSMPPSPEVLAFFSGGSGNYFESRNYKVTTNSLLGAGVILALRSGLLQGEIKTVSFVLGVLFFVGGVFMATLPSWPRFLSSL